MGSITGKLFFRFFDSMATDVLITKSEISDLMIERPVSFSIKGKHFSVFPATLGKMQLTARLLEAAGLSEQIEVTSLYGRILKAAQEHRSECLRLVAYATLKGDECLDENKVLKRLKELRKMDDVSIASLVVVYLSLDKSEQAIKHFAIDVETSKMNKVLKVKQDNKNTLCFGGRSVWGTLIDAACERYGWSLQYVLWDISYSNLRLMLADQVRSVYLSDEERKKVNVSNDRTIIRAEDSQSLEEFISTHSWR